MGFFSTAANNDERNLFIKQFEERVNEKIDQIELAELRTEKSVYQELNIKTYRPSIWGLLVLCEKNVYYYISAQEESYMSFISRNAKKTDEILISLTGLSSIKFSLPEKKLLSFLNPESSRTILISYRNQENIERNITAILNSKAETLYSKLQKYTGENK